MAGDFHGHQSPRVLLRGSGKEDWHVTITLQLGQQHQGVWMERAESSPSGSLGRERGPMSKTFKRGDHVEWNSEAGRVRGVILRKVISDVRFKGYVHRASKAEPQYFIASDKTDHVAIHKGRALRLIKFPPRGRARQPRRKAKQHG